MNFLRAAAAVVFLLSGTASARADLLADDTAPKFLVAQTAEHERAHDDSPGDTHKFSHDGHTIGAAANQQNGGTGGKQPVIGWLAGYCVVIILMSLLGGWLPQRLVLSHNVMQTAISLIGGLMLGIGLFHMLPHALIELGDNGPDLAAYGMMAGLIVMFLLLRAFHFHHHGTLDSLSNEDGSSCGHDHDHDHSHVHSHGGHHHGTAGTGPGKKLSWVGVFLGMAFHSLSDGLALGASIEADMLHGVTRWLGFGTFLAVAFHKPVDSISITMLMGAEGWSNRARTFVNIAFSMICPVGALLFVLGVQKFSESQSQIVGLALAASAGVFLCIALGDLLPEMEFHSHNRTRLTVALLLGVLIAWGIRFLEPPHSHSHAGHNHSAVKHRD